MKGTPDLWGDPTQCGSDHRDVAQWWLDHGRSGLPTGWESPQLRHPTSQGPWASPLNSRPQLPHLGNGPSQSRPRCMLDASGLSKAPPRR